MKLKNVPNNIFLNIGYEPEKGDDFNDLGEVTWCADKVNDNDIEYQRKPIWHDLRENPDDLPDRSKDPVVFVMTRLYKLVDHGIALYEGEKSSMMWIVGDLQFPFKDNRILAWMPIPKFKD